MEVYQRIKYLRKEILHMTQEEFAPSIKISRSNLGSIEIGRISVTDRVISDICEKHNVNRDWLMNGSGNPIIEISKENQLMEWAGNILKNESDSFKRRFVNMLMLLTEDEWEFIEKKARELVDCDDKKADG